MKQKASEGSKQILNNKFIEWEFLQDKKRNKIHNKTKNMDFSKIVIFKFNPSKMLNSIPSCFFNLFSKQGFLVIIFSLFKIPIFSNAEMILNEIKNYHYNFYRIYILIALILTSTAFHELGHAMSCTKFGSQVSNMGILLFFFFPCCFVAVNDIYMLNSRKKSMCMATSFYYKIEKLKSSMDSTSFSIINK